MKKIFLTVALVAVSLLASGCASQLQAVKAFNTSAVVSARAAADISVDDLKAATCSTTIDTYSRHPELTDAITSLCLNPNSAKASTPNQAQVLSSYKAATSSGPPAAANQVQATTVQTPAQPAAASQPAPSQ